MLNYLSIHLEVVGSRAGEGMGVVSSGSVEGHG